MPYAAEIFDAALRIAPDDVDSVLAFIRAWGLLGTRLPDHYTARWAQKGETVWGARRALKELQRHFAWAQALQRREWRSPDVPGLWGDQDAFLDALREVLPPPEHVALEHPWFDSRWPDLVPRAAMSRPAQPYPDPYVSALVRGHCFTEWARGKDVRPRDREEANWRAFGWAITEHLRAIHPAVGWNRGPTAAWSVPRLVDLLWVQLWNIVTGGGRMRRCRHCGKWFPGKRRGKVYCSRTCTNRASAAASYEARRNAVTRAARQQGRRPRR